MAKNIWRRDESGRLGEFVIPFLKQDIADALPLVADDFFEPTGGAGAQTVSPSAIGTAEAFGTAKANLTLFPGAVATAEAFGTPLVVLRLIASGIASGEALGTPAAHLRLFPAGVASAEAFGTATLLTPLTITPTGVASAEALGSLVLAFRVALGAIASAEAFGQARINLRVTAAGIGSAEALGQPSIALLIAAGAIGSSEAFGAPSLAFRLFPEGVASNEAFGAPVVGQAGPQTIVAEGIASAEAFGDLAARRPAEPQQGYDIPFHHWRARLARMTEERQPEHALDQVLGVVSVPSAEAVGGAKVIAHLRLIARGVPSGEVFGHHGVDQALLGPEELVALALILQEAA